MQIELEVNGRRHRLDLDPSRNLLGVLRYDLGLTGTKYGCGEDRCGACTVLVDGKRVHSCVTPVSSVAGTRITTIEGLEQDGRLHPVQQAFLDEGASQCGYCTPGMILASVALLSAIPSPSERDVAEALEGNVCRCGTHPRVVAAVRRAAAGSAPAPASGTGNGAAEDPGSDELREAFLRHDDGSVRRVAITAPAGGLVVVLAVPRGSGLPFRSRQSGESGAAGAGGPEEIGAWLHLAPDGAVTGFTGKVEFGQGNRTSLAQELAEELRAPLAAVSLVMGDTGRTPFDLGTFGSLSTPQMGNRFRKLGAAARELLIDRAAAHWGADRKGLAARDGRVHGHGGDRSLGYGELAGLGGSLEVVREGAPLTPATEWTTAGSPAPRAGARDLVTGRHRYTVDLHRPGMLVGKVLRPPSLGAIRTALDTSAAAALPGVTVVEDGDFVGVAAPGMGPALRALDAVQAMWKPASDPGPDSAGVHEHLRRRRPANPEGRWETGAAVEPFLRGDVEAALAAARHRLERTYTTAYIAHVPLEPRAAVAEWSEGEDGACLTVWTGTQRPFGVREQLAEAFGLPESRVRMIVPDTGAGYGGKHTGECAVEAARLARAAGRPVKLAWTREEEFRWAYFRPAAVIDVAAGMDAEGRLTAWRFANFNAGNAAIGTPYTVPNQRIQFHPSRTPLRQGSYRGLAATANHFAREMHMDELAGIAGLDPLEFRLRNLDDPRLAAVFEAAAERFGWGRELLEGHGAGLGGGIEKAAYVATCAEVAVDRARGGVKVVRAVTAFDCGAVVNPDGLRNQITGALIQGLGGALFEAVDFDHGVIRNALLSQYRVPRFSDVPRIEVVLLDRKDQPPAGAGETPLLGIAPAVGAAIHAACGVRPRSLPMARGGLATLRPPRSA